MIEMRLRVKCCNCCFSTLSPLSNHISYMYAQMYIHKINPSPAEPIRGLWKKQHYAWLESAFSFLARRDFLRAAAFLWM